MKKQIGIVAKSETTGYYMQQQIEKFLGGYVTTCTWLNNLGQPAPGNFMQSEMIIFSNRVLRQELSGQLPPDKKAIVAERTINIENVYKLLNLYKAQKMLVVATTQETAINTINIIKKLGFNYFDTVAYWPGCEVDTSIFNTALTTGLAYLVPSHIENVIDLGGKGIDISTFAVILKELEIPLSVLDNISNYYIQDIVKNAIKLKIEAKRNYTVRKSMASILNGISEGIIAFDKSEKVIFINKSAQSIFKLPYEQAMIKTASNLLPDDKEKFLSFNEAAEKIMTINGNAYIAKTLDLPGEVIESAESMVTLMPVDTVKELDVKVRREMRKKGNFAYYRFTDIIGKSHNLLNAIELAKNFAPTSLNILIEGESGVGKEVFAQSIHQASSRNASPFVAANFASIPTNLVESELFGYEEGAFTGAKKGGKRGLFEEAHMGTIFLDEIGSAPKDVQNRLLRVIEEKEIRRVGSNAIVPVNVRVIAATNAALYEQVQKGEFRLDLFYRLCAVPIAIPPLRERGDDILLMIKHFSRSIYGYQLQMTPELVLFIKKYPWLGNVRELNNFVNYICNLALAGKPADLCHLPKYMQAGQAIDKAVNKFQPVQPPLNDYFGELLSDENFTQDICCLLQELANSRVASISIGRYRLLQKLKRKNYSLTEYKLKYYLNLLAKNKLVKIGSTKQGTSITDSGLEFLHSIKAPSKI